MQRQADTISAQIGRADMRVQQAWWSLQHQLRQTADALNLHESYSVATSEPVILHRPAWNQFPYQRYSRYPSKRNRDAVAKADQLLAKIDGYIRSLRPVARQNRNAAGALASVQNLRHAVLAFRSTATSGVNGSPLWRSADRLMSKYQQSSSRVAEAVARDATLNSPLYYQIGELVKQVQYAVRGVHT